MDPNDMPSSADMDVPTSSPDPSTPVVETPAPPNGNGAPPVEPALAAPAPEVPEKPTTAKDAIALLTGVPADEAKPEAKAPAPVVPEKPAGRDSAAAKPEAKAPEDDPLSGLPPEQLKASTRDRILGLHSKAKAAETALAEVQPLVETGRAFDSLIKAHGLDRDLPMVEDAQVAGAIQFQAALNRMESGQGTPGDKRMVADVFATFDTTRAKLGFAAQPAAPDTAAIEAVIDKLADRFLIDPDAVPELKQALKAKAAAPTAPAPAAPAPTQPADFAQVRAPQAPQAPSFNPELAIYERRLASELTSAGVKDVAGYVSKTVLPVVLADLAKQLPPGVNPAAAFVQLSPSVRYELVMQAHTARAQAAPRPTPAKPAAQRPLGASQGASAPAAFQRPTSIQAAIKTLTG